MLTSAGPSVLSHTYGGGSSRKINSITCTKLSRSCELFKLHARDMCRRPKNSRKVHEDDHDRGQNRWHNGDRGESHRAVEKLRSRHDRGAAARGRDGRGGGRLGCRCFAARIDDGLSEDIDRSLFVIKSEGGVHAIGVHPLRRFLASLLAHTLLTAVLNSLASFDDAPVAGTIIELPSRGPQAAGTHLHGVVPAPLRRHVLHQSLASGILLAPLTLLEATIVVQHESAPVAWALALLQIVVSAASDADVLPVQHNCLILAHCGHDVEVGCADPSARADVAQLMLEVLDCSGASHVPGGGRLGGSSDRCVVQNLLSMSAHEEQSSDGSSDDAHDGGESGGARTKGSN
mmetsp:Transcript_72503/g.151330  ORF Transcript_72503/g.151330 Transcript_72503/m.151330 type:complete len:346 (-) Transcript_72503:45-1082(-)